MDKVTRPHHSSAELKWWLSQIFHCHKKCSDLNEYYPCRSFIFSFDFAEIFEFATKKNSTVSLTTRNKKCYCILCKGVICNFKRQFYKNFAIIFLLTLGQYSRAKTFLWRGSTIEAGWKKKARQRWSRLFGGGKICSIPCRASCFDSIDLKETVDFNRFFQLDRLNSTVSSK